MKKALQTIGFMVIITVLFISALAFINESSKARIQQNQHIDASKSVLYAFNIFPPGISGSGLPPTSTTSDIPWQENAVLETLGSQIKTIKVPVSAKQKQLLKDSYLTVPDSIEIYIRLNQDQQIDAYGFPLKGKGLWGTITAFGVISADLQKMIGIDFTDQVETPGLGARITEEEFKSFFRHLDLSGVNDQSRPIVMVSQKERSNLEQSTNELQAITGATQTCNGVLAMLNTDLPFYLAVLSNTERFRISDFELRIAE